MEHPQTISGLQRKRKELAKTVEIARDHLAVLSHDLEAIERALAVFGVIELQPTPRVYSTAHCRKEMRTLAIAMLKERGECTSRDITLELIERRGQSARDAKLYEKVQKGVGRALRRLEDRGAVVRRVDDGRVIWGLAP